MHEAIQCALLGNGHVSPNPRVGCVIVRDQQVISRGSHKQYGGIHAEVDALRSFHGDPSTSTMYVSLEPCAHVGKQPPCVDAILASGIRRLVVGMIDPNPHVAGHGVEYLRQQGIDVIVGVLQDSCLWLNRWFSHHATTGRSYVTAKIATSLDLAVTAPIGAERWITSQESRSVVHAMRAEYDAVMIGIGTVLADDPLLTVRDASGRNPIRLIIDTACRTPLGSQIVQTAGEIRTIILCDEGSMDSDSADQLRTAGLEVIGVTAAESTLDPSAIVSITGALGISSILLEGGPRLLRSFLNSDRVNELVLHVAPAFLNPDIRWFESVEPSGFRARSCTLVGPDLHAVYTVDQS